MQEKPTRRGPPPIESILVDAGGKSDIGYQYGIHMVGLHGAWHRLWASLILVWQMDSDVDGVVHIVREQVSEALGRPMTDSEFARLKQDADEYAANLGMRGQPQ